MKSPRENKEMKRREKVEKVTSEKKRRMIKLRIYLYVKA